MGFLLILAVQIALLTVLLWLILYFMSMLISDFIGVPFVPTSKRLVRDIFKKFRMTKNDVFYDLGCGDGRLVFYVAKKYGCRAVGVEVNPLLHCFARLVKKITKTDNVFFLKKNIFKVDLQEATVIYLFLFPEIIERLKNKILKECKNVRIISHGFVIKGWGKYLISTDHTKPFKTYYYRR